MVDTENLTYYDGSKLSGTSYAAPKALCIIRAVMDETGVSAEEAMYAVKTPNSPTPKVIKIIAKIRPSVVMGYLSP